MTVNKHQPCTPEFVSTCPLPHEWSSGAQIQLVLAGMPDGARHTNSDWVCNRPQVCQSKAWLTSSWVLNWKRLTMRTYLSLSGWHKLEDDVFEILKVDFSRVVEVWGVGHRGVGGWGARGGCWRWVWTNPLVFFCSAFWHLLLCFSFWLRL